MRRFALFCAVLFCGPVFLSACDSGTTDGPDQGTRLNVYLTDAPGDVAAIWVDVAEIYFQGGPE